MGLIADTECLLPLPMPKDVATASLGGSLESYVMRDRLWAYPIDAACQVAVKRADLCDMELPDWEAVVEGGYDVPMITPLLPVDALDMMMTLVAGRGEEDLPPYSDRTVLRSKRDFVTESPEGALQGRPFGSRFVEPGSGA